MTLFIASCMVHVLLTFEVTAWCVLLETLKGDTVQVAMKYHVYCSSTVRRCTLVMNLVGFLLGCCITFRLLSPPLSPSDDAKKAEQSADKEGRSRSNNCDQVSLVLNLYVEEDGSNGNNSSGDLAVYSNFGLCSFPLFFFLGRCRPRRGRSPSWASDLSVRNRTSSSGRPAP